MSVVTAVDDIADRIRRVRGYDFLGPVGSRRRSDDWDALHRRRAARGRDGAGMRRDTLAGCDHDALWRDVWVPTDAAFALGFDAMNSCAHWNSLRLAPPRQST